MLGVYCELLKYSSSTPANKALFDKKFWNLKKNYEEKNFTVST